MLGTANQRDAIAYLHAHRICQAFADQDVIHIAAGEIAPSLDILTDDVHG